MPNDAYAAWDPERRRLEIGNAVISRRWDADPQGRLTALSIEDRARGVEWLRGARRQAPTATVAPPAEPRTLEFQEQPSPDGLLVTLTASGPTSRLTYRFQIRPGVAAITQSLRAEGARTAAAEDVMESLILAPQHLRLGLAIFLDGTDDCNELLHEAEWLLHPAERELRLQGALFTVENTFTGNGLILLKHAPLPDSRPQRCPADLIARGADRSLELLGHGLTPEDENFGYEWTVLLSQNGKPGRTAALQRFQRSLRPYRPGRDGLIVANTWGDRSQDGRISASFIAAEIEAAQALGIDVVQIDDGWQKGVTTGSVVGGGVWDGFHAADPEFWSVHPQRFPDGLKPLVAQASQAGVRLGLWFAPDSSNHFEHWRRDADRILQLRDELGVEHFKIDSVHLTTKPGERNLHAFYDRVVEGSESAATLDVDITSDIRTGYFGRMDCGPLFVENRYTDTRRYWPHFTLRNLWRLAHYIDPLRLRMEWLNNRRNFEAYAGDPLAPDRYAQDYLFATVMFSSPLAWFELSRLPEDARAEVAPLIATWKAHRDAIFSGVILPIGAAPDGLAWTGFAALGPNASYLLVFRELNDQPQARLALPLARFAKAEVLAGEGRVEIEGAQALVTIPEPMRYVFARLSA